MFSLSSLAYSENSTVKVYEFYAQGCIHCAAVDRYLVNLEREYPEVEVARFEVSHSQDNLYLGKKFCEAYGLNCSQHVPTPIVFVNNTYILGDKLISENLKPIVIRCIENTCEDAMVKVKDVKLTDANMEPPLTVVILAAMVDSINPCAFAVLIFMLQYVGSIATKRKMINSGLVYIAVVYVTYMLAGLGILTAFQSLTMTDVVYKLAAVLAIIAGIINIKDYFFYGKWISLEIPKSQKKRVEGFVQQATLPAAIALGVLVSAVELPCTGGAYLAILAMLQWAPFWKAFVYLALYNIFFVLPLIAILLLFTMGYSADTLEKMRLEKRKYMRLGIGLLLFFLGVGMYLGWFTGGYWTS
jgi:cytochrome c biogenesis protein CcdA